MKNLILLLLASVSFGQVSHYKYAIVASKFKAQKSAGQYGLNELAKQFMLKNGFQVFLDNEPLPAEVAADNCKTMFVDVKQENNMFWTKLQVVITDCRKQVIFTSALGESKEKDLRLANNQALRMAFRSLDKPELRYQPSAVNPVSDPTAGTASARQIPSGTNAYLSVQPTPTGFQIIDTAPKILLRLYRTSIPGIYIAKSDQAEGVFFQRDGKWHFEYYLDGQMISEPFDVTVQ